MTKSHAFLAPVVPGKTEKLRAMVKEAQGPRRTEHTESRERLNLTHERVFHQPTPQGELCVIFVEGPGADKLTEGLSKSDQPYDKWFREELAQIHGIDFSQGPAAAPKSELAFTYEGEGTGGTATGFAAPIVKLDDWRKLVAEMKGPRKEEHAASRRRLGIAREQAFHTSTPQGDFVIVYLEGKDAGTAMQRMAESNDAYDKWFTEQITDVHGLDLTKPLPKNEELLHWQKEPATVR